MLDPFSDEDFGGGRVDEIELNAVLVVVVGISFMHDGNLKEQVIELLAGEVKRLIPFACFFEEELCAVIGVGLEFFELLGRVHLGVLVQLLLQS